MIETASDLKVLKIMRLSNQYEQYFVFFSNTTEMFSFFFNGNDGLPFIIPYQTLSGPALHGSDIYVLPNVGKYSNNAVAFVSTDPRYKGIRYWPGDLESPAQLLTTAFKAPAGEMMPMPLVLVQGAPPEGSPPPPPPDHDIPALVFPGSDPVTGRDVAAFLGLETYYYATVVLTATWTEPVGHSRIGFNSSFVETSEAVYISTTDTSCAYYLDTHNLYADWACFGSESKGPYKPWDLPSHPLDEAQAWEPSLNFTESVWKVEGGGLLIDDRTNNVLRYFDGSVAPRAIPLPHNLSARAGGSEVQAHLAQERYLVLVLPVPHPVNGNEPVVLDLNTWGVCTADINPGVAGSSPILAGIVLDTYAVFQASSPDTGVEPWYWTVEDCSTKDPVVMSTVAGSSSMVSSAGESFSTPGTPIMVRAHGTVPSDGGSLIKLIETPDQPVQLTFDTIEVASNSDEYPLPSNSALVNDEVVLARVDSSGVVSVFFKDDTY